MFHKDLETNRSKRSTEYQSNLSPRDTKTDDSKLEMFTDKDRIIELEFELQQTHEQNEYLRTENESLRGILKDYESMKTNEDLLTERLEVLIQEEQKLKVKVRQMTKQSTDDKKVITDLQSQLLALKKENSRLESTADMNINHQDTQIRLLKEALNKRNDDIKELESNNDELVKLLEK